MDHQRRRLIVKARSLRCTCERLSQTTARAVRRRGAFARVVLRFAHRINWRPDEPAKGREHVPSETVPDAPDQPPACADD